MDTSADVDRADGRRTDTRARILDIATDLFRERGYAATTIQTIADELGVTKAALYYHFASKEEIMLALKQPIVDSLAAVLSGSVDCASAAGRRAFLTELVEAMVQAGVGVASIMTDAHATADMRQAVEQTGLPDRAMALLIAGLAGVTNAADAPPAAVLRANAALGSLHGGFDAWIRLDHGQTLMDAATVAVIIDAACAALESGG